MKHKSPVASNYLFVRYQFKLTIVIFAYYRFINKHSPNIFSTNTAIMEKVTRIKDNEFLIHT